MDAGYRISEFGTWEDATHVCVCLEIDHTISKVDVSWTVIAPIKMYESVTKMVWLDWTPYRRVGFDNNVAAIRLEHSGPVRMRFLITTHEGVEVIHFVEWPCRQLHDYPHLT